MRCEQKESKHTLKSRAGEKRTDPISGSRTKQRTAAPTRGERTECRHTRMQGLERRNMFVQIQDCTE